MKVGELKQLLDSYEDNTDVVVAYQYGDYWRTVAADDFDDIVVGLVEKSERLRSWKIVTDEGGHLSNDEDDLEDEDVDEGTTYKRAVIITGERLQ